MLKLSDNLVLPPEAVTQTFGILAVRGAGKSNVAGLMAERMFENKLPFIVIDYDGSWWGLRSSADGKSDGLSVAIFGGEHGDVPIERSSGVLVADLVAEEGLSSVLDLSGFESEAARKGFLLDFARRLYARNRRPLHIFADEADEYIPQKPMRDEAILLRAWENIVRRGRKRGIGITLVTQRSAAINKNVLTQVETLIAMRTTAPHDRNAIEAWLKYHAQAHEIVGSLAGLGNGEAWVWSPNFLRKTLRTQFPLRSTYDSGATPALGSRRRPPATLATIDLEAVREKMKVTIERAKQEDPKELRARITLLERQLKARSHDENTEALQDERSRRKAAEAAMKATAETLANISTMFERIKKAAVEGPEMIDRAVRGIHGFLRGQADSPAPAANPPYKPMRRVSQMTSRQAAIASGARGELTGPERRILDAIAWLKTIGVEEPEQTAVAFLAGYTFGGGAFNNPRGRLKSKGFVEYRGDRIVLTDEGRSLAEIPDRPLTTEELHARVLERLPGPERRILTPLLERYPKEMRDDELAEASNYTAGAGAFNNPKGRLRSLGLIEYPAPRTARARSILFLDGASK